MPRAAAGGTSSGSRSSSPRRTAEAVRVRDVSNQGRFYDRFDAVVLLSSPADVLLDRIASRTTNVYGNSLEERELILVHLREVEPLLRATCPESRPPLADVVARLARWSG